MCRLAWTLRHIFRFAFIAIYLLMMCAWKIYIYIFAIRTPYKWFAFPLWIWRITVMLLTNVSGYSAATAATAVGVCVDISCRRLCRGFHFHQLILSSSSCILAVAVGVAVSYSLILRTLPIRCGFTVVRSTLQRRICFCFCRFFSFSILLLL